MCTSINSSENNEKHCILEASFIGFYWVLIGRSFWMLSFWLLKRIGIFLGEKSGYNLFLSFLFWLFTEIIYFKDIKSFYESKCGIESKVNGSLFWVALFHQCIKSTLREMNNPISRCFIIQILLDLFHFENLLDLMGLFLFVFGQTLNLVVLVEWFQYEIKINGPANHWFGFF